MSIYSQSEAYRGNFLNKKRCREANYEMLSMLQMQKETGHSHNSSLFGSARNSPYNKTPPSQNGVKSFGPSSREVGYKSYR